MFPVDHRIVSVFCLLGDTVDTHHASVVGCCRFISQILFYVQVGLAYRGPGSVSWCRLKSTENLDSGLSPYSVFEVVGQRIQFTRRETCCLEMATSSLGSYIELLCPLSCLCASWDWESHFFCETVSEYLTNEAYASFVG